MKNNLQGINSRVDETENQSNDLEHKEEKDIQSFSNKKNPKNWGECKEPLEQLKVFQHSHNGCQNEKRKHKKLETYLKK